MTAENFSAFLYWLAPNETEPGEAYERLRFRLITYFSGRKYMYAEELADETINRVCLKIGDLAVENKIGYIYGFAKNVYRESLRKEKVFLNVEEIPLSAKQTDETRNAGGDCLERCLGELSAENRGLILEYYSEDKQAKIDLHRELADRFATTQTALRMRIVRIKQRLKNCVEECLAA